MTHPFTDVPDGAYYADAVEWAWSNGLTTGVSPDRFAPDDPVTRAQLVTMLHRYDQTMTDLPLPTQPEPPDPDPPLERGPVFVPKFGGGEVGILIPDGFRQHGHAWAKELDAAADRIEALEAALRDAATLLPPERWGLLQPSTREALDA